MAKLGSARRGFSGTVRCNLGQQLHRYERGACTNCGVRFRHARILSRRYELADAAVSLEAGAQEYFSSRFSSGYRGALCGRGESTILGVLWCTRTTAFFLAALR